MDRLVTVLLAVGAFFVKLGFDLGRRQGRAELTDEQRRIADAIAADFEAITNDGRTVDDALSRLRERRRVHHLTAKRDGRLPKVP